MNQAISGAGDAAGRIGENVSQLGDLARRAIEGLDLVDTSLREGPGHGA